MIVLVDAMCAQMGGIATYAENLLDRWCQHFPDDELHVLVPAGAGQNYRGCVMHEVRIRRPNALWRPLATTVFVQRLCRELKPDGVLATLPSTSLIKPGVPTLVVVHDLRHKLRPEQFALSRRLMRSVSYTRGYRIADAFIAVSHRTLADFRRHHPRAARKPATVVHHGADHVDSWLTEPQTAQPLALAFAHHSNKNLAIVMQAWHLMLTVGVPKLAVVGVPAGDRSRVEADIASLGLADLVEIYPYLPDAAFQVLMTSADLVVFPSDSEGFGLPVLESMRLGIPVVAGPDPAVIEVSGGHATVMREFTSPALVEAVREALSSTPAQLAVARTHAESFTWAAAVTATRDALCEHSFKQSRRTPEEIG